ncbi:MAG: matrixin family metalloprotease [Bryobacteraceae bacterium]
MLSLRATAAVVCLPMLAAAAEPRFKAPAETSKQGVRRTLNPRRVHRLVWFANDPGLSEWRRVEATGAKPLQWAPGAGLLVAAPPEWDGREAGAVRAGDFDRGHKWSPKLAALGAPAWSVPAWYVVEFFPDVPPAEARAIAIAEGLRFREHPDMRRDHLLVEGTPANTSRLTQWDEVAYVFPASGALVRGDAVHACAGGLTYFGSGGTVGDFIETIGDGWDGPGQGAADLTYHFQNMTTRVDAAQGRAEVERALAEWSRYVRIHFTPSATANAARQIDIIFGAGSHGDPYPFDGPGQVLAHTFYPSPPNGETRAGDMHFDDAESWRIGSDIDIFSVTLHELGHAIGLGHSDQPTAVMFPYYQRTSGLSQEDITHARLLYAAEDAQPVQAVAAAPAAGGSTTQTFSFTFSHDQGAARLDVMNILINNAVDGRSACYLAFVRSSSTLYLVNDSGDAGGPYAGTMALPGSGSISNSQCTVFGAGSQVLISGNTLHLTLNLQFASQFAGDRVLYLAARDSTSGNSGWRPKGVWSVPGADSGTASVSNNTPRVESGTVAMQTAYTAANGSSLAIINLLINSAIDGRQACYVAYVVATRTLVLVNDDGDAGGPYAGSISFPGSGAAANSQCAISASGSTVSGDANSLSLTLQFTFSGLFSGDRVVYLAARDTQGNSTGWRALGTVTIP